MSLYTGIFIDVDTAYEVDAVGDITIRLAQGGHVTIYPMSEPRSTHRAQEHLAAMKRLAGAVSESLKRLEEEKKKAKEPETTVVVAARDAHDGLVR